VLELAASGVDIAAARTAHEGGNSGSRQHALEGEYAIVGRRGKGNLRTWIQGDQIYFGPQTANQVNHLSRVLHLIVNPSEQDVLESQPLAVAEREVA
jgi:hypothetical protein